MERFKIFLLTVAVSVQVTSQDSTVAKLTVTPDRREFFPDEVVTLRCEIEGGSSGWTFLWTKDTWTSENKSVLPIIVKHSESGVYSCAGKLNATVTSQRSNTFRLNVKELPLAKIQSDWTEAFPGEKVSLQCVIQGVSEKWNYLWFKGSDKIVSSSEININENTLTLSVESSHDGAYECQAELQDRKVITARSTMHSLRVHGSKPTLVLKQDPSDSEIYTGEKVTFTCGIQEETSQWKYQWKKGSAQVSSDRIYTVSSAAPSDDGTYTCQVERRGTTFSESTKLIVRELPQLKLSLESQWNIFYPTEKVTLKCSIDKDSNKWGYEWFKNETPLHIDKDISLSENTLSISSAKVSHSGQYTCRGKHLTRPTVTTNQTKAVQLQINDNTPKPTITKQWFEFFYTEERVQLQCNMPGDSWKYHWYKDSNLRVTNPELTIVSASVSDTGDFYCKAQRGDFSVDSETVQVRVQKPPEPQIQSDWTETFPGENVSLQCVIQDVSKNWNYLWFKGSDRISSSVKININGNTLTLSVESSHNGAYVCQAELQDRKVMTAKSAPHSLRVHGSQPTLLLEQDPSDPEIYTGERVKLSCSIKEKTSQWKHLWNKDSAQVSSDRIYTISSAAPSDDGTYTCQVERRGITFSSTQSKKLIIKERPQLKLSLESKWKIFYPTEKVTLKCSVDKDSNKWGYEWFRNGTQLHLDKDVSLSGNTLSISSAKVSHSGQYTCRGKHLIRPTVTTNQTKAVQLQINDNTPKPNITKHEWFEPFYTDEQVQLHCNMPGDGWEYHWHKDSNPPTTNPEFTINSASVTDTGVYHCKAQRGDFSVDSETVQVQVEARPPAILTLETELSDIMTGEVTLRCNVSDGRQWSYTWYMNRQQLNESSDVLKVPGNEETIKSEFKCKGIRTVRPLYSALSEGFIANNIIFKRKILLAISGCLICCIVILIIGCIVLKITRKQAEVKETAAEDLFFSMTDSKNQTVSPMNEYMDNRTTELEECKEKEELITDRASAVHEDGVIKDEETPASEANGMKSFTGL